MYRRIILFALLGCCLTLWALGNDTTLDKSAIAARHAINSRSMVGNDFVQVYCDDATGMFTVGTTDGDCLTFGYPSEGSTTHITVKIDDTIYSNDEWMSDVVMLNEPTTTVVDNTIITTCDQDGIVLTQYLQPVQSDSAGAIWIYYDVVNNTSEPHDVGILLEIDTQIGDNDGAPLATSYGLVDVETEFVQPNMPTYWQAYESPDYDPDFLIGEGVLLGSSAVAPDYFCAGAWGALYDVTWDYTASGSSIYDSAVIYRWDQTTLQAGGTRMVGTLYGTGEVSVNQGALTLLLSAPEELIDMGGYLLPNPFEVNLIVHNAVDMTAQNVQATIGLQEGLSVEAGTETQSTTPVDIESGGVGTCSWLVTATNPPEGVTYTIVVEVTSDNVDGNSVSREIYVPMVALDDNDAPVARSLLEQNEPNPFNPSTRIAFNLPQPGYASIRIYDARGRLVKSFDDIAAPDKHGEVVWNGRDNDGNSVASGLYFYQLRQNGVPIDTRRMTLLK